MKPIPTPRAYRMKGAPGSAEGLLYGELPPSVEEALPRWLGASVIPEGEELKAGRAYRVGAFVVKLVPAPTGWRRWRRSHALRAAEAAREIQPIGAPRPLLALQAKRGTQVGSGLLITEFVKGQDLAEVWEDSRAVEALPLHLAASHRQRVFHGDLHPRNLLYDGEEWVLLDLESLRHGLHMLFRASLIRGQWSRLYRNMRYVRTDIEPRFRELFQIYLEASDLGWNPDREWRRIMGHAERAILRRGIPVAGAL